MRETNQLTTTAPLSMSMYTNMSEAPLQVSADVDQNDDTIDSPAILAKPGGGGRGLTRLASKRGRSDADTESNISEPMLLRDMSQGS